MIERLSILGFGNLQEGPKVAATLANFFGERESEVFCWDPRKEQCDIMCRVLRYFLKVGGVRHFVYSFNEPEQALDASNGVIILNQPSQFESSTFYPILRPSLPVFEVDHNDVEYDEDVAKFQCLRWINKEEYPSELIYAHREGPLLDWLNQL